MMRQFHKTIVGLLLAMIVLTTAVCAADSGAGTLCRRDTVTIGGGLTYFASAYTGNDGLPQAGYTLELAPDSEVYPILMPGDTVWGGRTLDWMVEYAQSLGYNVVAGVNTAFFNTPGVPIGIAVENGELQVAADEAYAFAVLDDGSYYVSENTALTVTLTNGDSSFPIPRLNKLLEGEGLHLYTDDYSTVSTRIEEDVWAVRMQRLGGELTLNGSVTLQVMEVYPAAQAVPIGEGYMVLSALTDGENGELYKKFAPGDILTLTTACGDETLSRAVQVSGCGDVLVKEGKIADERLWNPWIAGANPRTLIGWKADGTLVIHVADGRKEDYSNGLTLRQCAEEMLRLGCVWAVNMDGGGSSVMGARLPGSGTVSVVNHPSDGGQRLDAAYLLLVTDEPADGKARYYHLNENNLMVLPGQRVSLTVYATDAGLYPAALPEGKRLYAIGDEITDIPVVTAPDSSGNHWLNVWGGGASGGGTLQVISQPTELQLTYEGGSLPDRLVLQRGETMALQVTAAHNGRAMFADNTAIRYTQSVTLGTVDADGNFTARALHGTKGTLTVQVGAYSHDIAVTVVDSKTNYRENKIKTAIDWYSIFD